MRYQFSVKVGNVTIPKLDITVADVALSGAVEMTTAEMAASFASQMQMIDRFETIFKGVQNDRT